MSEALSERALILAPHGRDAAIAAGILQETGIVSHSCANLGELVGSLRQGAGFALVTEEGLHTSDLRGLSEWIEQQPEWSDFPFVLLTNRGGGIERNPAAGRHLETLGNVTFLERPFHPTTLTSLARAAIRARRRQYDARARLIAIRESEARYRTLFDTMDEGFCVIQFRDGPDGELSDYVHVEANGAFERHAGLHEVIGRSVRELVGEEAEGWIALYREVLVSGKPIRFERRLEATDRYLELAAFRVEPAERREVAVLFQDVTERRKAEAELVNLNATLERRVDEALADREAATAQLREAQKLETLGQLTGGLAHDMNNLLTPILSTLDLLERRYGATDERAARAIERSLQSAERAKTLVSRMLGFARRQSLEPRPLGVSTLINGMRDLIASSVGSSVELEIDVPGSLAPILADPNQLELALLNLCLNAKDAMPAGGRIVISAAAVSNPPADLEHTRESYVRISVTDTGSGMDEETLKKAIEPFFSTKEIGKGTGLGLSLVHGFARQSNGAFSLASAPGKGTRADLYLPVSNEGIEAQVSDRERSSQAERALKVLIVDDEPLVRMSVADMLEQLGHTPIEAANGAEALELLQTTAGIDAVITDYTMPHMNGSQLARKVRESHCAIPVLLITGFAADSVDHDLPYLPKPFRLEDLAGALKSLL